MTAPRNNVPQSNHPGTQRAAPTTRGGVAAGMVFNLAVVCSLLTGQVSQQTCCNPFGCGPVVTEMGVPAREYPQMQTAKTSSLLPISSRARRRRRQSRLRCLVPMERGTHWTTRGAGGACASCSMSMAAGWVMLGARLAAASPSPPRRRPLRRRPPIACCLRGRPSSG